MASESKRWRDETKKKRKRERAKHVTLRSPAYTFAPRLPPPPPPPPTPSPIIWATCEGGRVGSVDTETIAYVFFDIVAKCVFGFIMMMSHEALEAAEVLELKAISPA